MSMPNTPILRAMRYIRLSNRKSQVLLFLLIRILLRMSMNLLIH